MSGLEVAGRTRQNDADAVMIFATGHIELMRETFRVQFFQFLTKPYNGLKAVGVLLCAIQRLQNRRALFQYSPRKKIHTLSLPRIMYLESRERKMVIHTANGETNEYYGAIKEAEQKTAGPAFAQLHSS